MAPASVGIDTFPNKKSKLIGNTSGVDPVNQLNYSTPIGSGGTAIIDNFDETIWSTTTLIAIQAINKGFIRRTQGVDIASGNSLTFRIREDNLLGAILASDTNSGNFLMDLSAIITNQSVGARNYVFTLQLNTVMVGDFYRLHTDPTSLAYIVDIADTHSAKNTNIING